MERCSDVLAEQGRVLRAVREVIVKGRKDAFASETSFNVSAGVVSFLGTTRLDAASYGIDLNPTLWGKLPRKSRQTQVY